MAVFRGDKKSNVLNGTSSKDWMYGFFGNDVINGRVGDDYLSGNEGNDKLSGGEGDDALYGGAGKDAIYGGAGYDHLDGGFDTVKDVLYGDAGNDTVVVRQNDVAFGGSGTDTLSIGYDFSSTSEVLYKINLSKINGKGAAKTGYLNTSAAQFERADVAIANAADGSSVIGSKGDDTLFVSAASGGVTINGGAGTDKIMGGVGADALIGGSGSDLFVVSSLFGQADTIRDFSKSDFILIGEAASGYLDPALMGVDLDNYFVAGSEPAATSTKGQFLYDTDDGRLLYDADGSADGEAVHLFTLANKVGLKATNFVFDF